MKHFCEDENSEDELNVYNCQLISGCLFTLNTFDKQTNGVCVCVAQSVAMETVEETGGAQTRLDGDETDFDLE